MSEGEHVVCVGCGQVNRVPTGRPAAKAVCGRCGKPLFDGHPADIDEAALDRQLERSTIPVVVDFWAPWCGPCRAMAPSYERAARDLEPAARLLKVNVDNAQALAARLGISGIPALFVFRGGRVLARQAGAMDAASLRRFVERALDQA